MGGIGVWQVLIVAVIVLVLFGRGRISEMMGDFGKGVKSFKQGIADEEVKPAEKPNGQIEGPAAKATTSETQATKPTDNAK